MNKVTSKTIRITIHEECYTELMIISMRKKIDVKDLISEILEKHADKKKESISNNT